MTTTTRKPDLTYLGKVGWGMLGVSIAFAIDLLLRSEEEGVSWMLMTWMLLWLAVWGWITSSVGRINAPIAAALGFQVFVVASFIPLGSWPLGWVLHFAATFAAAGGAYIGGMLAWHAVDDAQRRRATR